MGTRRARTRGEIYADILSILGKWGSCARLSRLAMAAGVPYDRLVKYLGELREMGLVEYNEYFGFRLSDRVTKVVSLDRDSLVKFISSLRAPGPENQ